MQIRTKIADLPAGVNFRRRVTGARRRGHRSAALTQRRPLPQVWVVPGVRWLSSCILKQQPRGEKMIRMASRSTALLASVSLAALAAVMANQTAAARDDDVVHTHYDGITNDLLTAGLGKTVLGNGPAPGFADPLHPTAEELRRLAIFNNYRALVDPTSGGGFGLLYGPNVTANGTVTSGEGLIAGDEYLAFEKGDDGRTNVTMMVQVPDTFDPASSCIVAAPSSGSRGVYG